jgi:hypothetical protein
MAGYFFIQKYSKKLKKLLTIGNTYDIIISEVERDENIRLWETFKQYQRKARSRETQEPKERPSQDANFDNKKQGG